MRTADLFQIIRKNLKSKIYRITFKKCIQPEEYENPKPNHCYVCPFAGLCLRNG